MRNDVRLQEAIHVMKWRGFDFPVENLPYEPENVLLMCSIRALTVLFKRKFKSVLEMCFKKVTFGLTSGIRPIILQMDSNSI